MKCRSKSPIIINPQSKPGFEQAALVYKRRLERRNPPQSIWWSHQKEHALPPTFGPISCTFGHIWSWCQLQTLTQILTSALFIWTQWKSIQNPFQSPNVHKIKGPQLTLVYAKLLLCRSSVMMTFLHIPYYTTHTYNKHRLLFFYSVLSDLAFVDEKTVLAASTIGPIERTSSCLFHCSSVPTHAARNLYPPELFRNEFFWSVNDMLFLRCDTTRLQDLGPKLSDNHFLFCCVLDMAAINMYRGLLYSAQT